MLECWLGHPQGYGLNSSFSTLVPAFLGAWFFGGSQVLRNILHTLWHFHSWMQLQNKENMSKYLRSLSRKSRASGETRCWFSECTKRSHLENNSNVAIQWLGASPRLTFSCCVCQGCPRSVDRAQSGTCPSTRRALLCQAPELDHYIDVCIVYTDVIFFHPTLQRWGQAHERKKHMPLTLAILTSWS